MTTVMKSFLLLQFLLSAPITMIFVFHLKYDRDFCAIVNSYGFSTAMLGLYLYPFILPLSSRVSFASRLHDATMNWVIWLSVFTEVMFQIPHNVFVDKLHQFQGTSIEWPFYAYGLSDSRWNNYHGGSGLAPEVWLINCNDAGLGLVVLICLLNYWRVNKTSQAPKARLALILAVLFRDATLWRETVEYMWDMHRKSYPYSTADPLYRHHAITCLWLVNVVWLIAPVLSVVWAYQQVTSMMAGKTKDM